MGRTNIGNAHQNRRENNRAAGEKTKLPNGSEAPDTHGNRRPFGIGTLYFLLRPGCLLEQAELPVTVEFTTEGFRTTVTFERMA